MPTRQEIQPQLPPPLSDHEGRPATRGLDDEMGGLPPQDRAEAPRLPSVSRFQTYREKVGDAIPGYLSTRVEHDTDIRRLFRQTTPAILAHYLDAINRLDYYADVAETVGNVSLAAACATSKARCSAKGIELALGRSLNIHATISDQSQVPNWLDLPEAERQKYLHQRALLQLDNPAERGVESAEEAVIEGQVEGGEDGVTNKESRRMGNIPTIKMDDVVENERVRSGGKVESVGPSHLANDNRGGRHPQESLRSGDNHSGDRHTTTDIDERGHRLHPLPPKNRHEPLHRASEAASPSSPPSHPQGPPQNLDESREPTGEGRLSPDARKS